MTALRHKPRMRRELDPAPKTIAAAPSRRTVRDRMRSWVYRIPDSVHLPLAASVSLLLYMESWSTGSPLGTAAFIAIWLLPLLVRPALVAELTRQVVVWALPGLAMASTLWSRAPQATFKAALEYIVFTAAVIVMARLVPIRTFLIGICTGFGVLVVASAVSGAGNLSGSGGEFNLVGVFASKNALSLCAGVTAYCALATALTGRNVILVRLAALVLFCASALVVVLAHSVDGDVSLGLACLVLVGLTPLSAFSRPSRNVMLVALGGVLAIAAVLVMVLPSDTFTDVLLAVGKSPDLTGRAYMWLRAKQYLAEAQWLGVGYSAFWQQGFADAIGMWRHAGIGGETGYHFHNLYYETAIELGRLGLVVISLTFLAGFVRAVVQVSRDASSLVVVQLATMVYFLCRITLEVDFIFAFNVGNLVFTAMYVYSQAKPLRTWRRVETPVVLAAPATAQSEPKRRPRGPSDRQAVAAPERIAPRQPNREVPSEQDDRR